MPIKQLRNDSITQRCAKCGTERDIEFSDLEIGVEIDSEAGFKDTNIIALPACVKCGSKEFLLRNWDKSNEPDTSGRLLHRKTVNRLAQYLKEMGRINSACVEEISVEDRQPPDIFDKPIDGKGMDIIIDRNKVA
jgi:hypothetical protein